MDTVFGTITSGLIGIGLAAACGFRVFVPMLVMSIAVKAGLLDLTDGWSWLGSWTALVALFVATVAEVSGYYIPWFDHLLDTMASPAAVVAGTLATAACISGMDPLLQWSAAIIAGDHATSESIARISGSISIKIPNRCMGRSAIPG
jgi:hypothetical protein